MKDREEYISILEQDNAEFKKQIEVYQKVLDDTMSEKMDLEEENKQLKDNWNKLKEVIRKKQDYYRYVKDNRYRKFLSELLDKMQELQGSREWWVNE